MAKQPTSIATKDELSNDEKAAARTWHRWNSELDYALKDKEYKAWVERCEKIVKRYRDVRDSVDQAKRRFNILWSNVETLQPAVLARPPKALAERKFLDRDPVGRLASMILERCLNNQIEQGYLFESAKQGVVDHLLCGMGVMWPRYVPQFETAKAANENKKVEREEADDNSDLQEEGDGAPYQRVASESVCFDYVYWKDLLWGTARWWREVPWVAKRCWKTHSEIAEDYYGGDMEKAKKVNLDYSPNADANDMQAVGYFKKAELWQFWNLADRTVYTIAPGTPGIVLQEEKNPELKLQNFWPASKPAFATQTNDTVVPVPDYIQYQDQASELDDLTQRIAALTTALKVSGVYDSSIPALQRLFQNGADNILIPVDQWAMFAEKGGMKGAIDIVPLKEIAETLIGLHEARNVVKQDLYEITGMSDIMRGQGEASATATQDRIKAQFGSMRLEKRREVINNWLLETIKIGGEIICEQFGEDTLLKMSGVDLKIADDVRKAVAKVPPPPKPEPPQPMEGQLPPDPQQVQMAMQQAEAQGQAMFQQMQQQVAAAAQAKGMKEFQDAVALLKSDKMRGFRVDIETDSTIVADAQADKEGAQELVGGVMEALTAAGPIIQSAPEFAEPIGQMLMWAFRKFRVGRPVEASLEDALDQLNERIEGAKNQPPPPSPEQMEAEAKAAALKQQTEASIADTQARAEADAKVVQAKAQADKQKQVDEAERARQKHQYEMDSAAIKRQADADKHAREMAKIAVDEQAARDDAGRKLTEHNAKMGAQDQQHRQAMEKTSTESNAKRTEAGLPGDEAWTALAQEMKDAREASMQEIKVLAGAIEAMGEAISAEKEIETPDGKRYTSRVRRGKA